jgi:hypothetical protein
MAARKSKWKVLAHEPVQKLSENLWRVEGTLDKMAFRRVMTLARRSDGAVVVHSAIALEPELMAEIEAWGEPQYLIVPSRYHRLDAAAFVARYPSLRVFSPRAAIKAVKKVTAQVQDYEAYPTDASVELCDIPGLGQAEGAMVVHSSDGTTLVLNDIIFNMPHQPGLIGWLMRYATRSTGEPVISRVSRLLLVRQPQNLKAWLLEQAQRPDLCRLIVSHHEMVSDRPGEVLRRVAEAL